jgi:serpin B
MERVTKPPPAFESTSNVALPHVLASARLSSQQDVTGSSNAFAFDTYAKLRRENGNLAFSPASLWIALAMTWGGARGETAAQMGRVLHARRPPATLLPEAGQLAASLVAAGPVVFRIANRLFGDQAAEFIPAFLETTRATFGAPLEPVNFRGAHEAARARINDWVAQQTEQRIRELIPRGGVDNFTRLALVNALYFLADWQSEFKKESTHTDSFHLSAMEQKDVRMMYRQMRLPCARGGGRSAIELAYKGGRFAMLLVLPDAVDGLAALEASLTPVSFDGLVGSLADSEATVLVPKFTIDPPESIELAETLQEMGMPLAFKRHVAEFTGIADPADPGERLFIAKVFHKAFVKVDEKGTEAAAATAVVMAAPMGAAPAPPPFVFRADHPFLFFIRDRQTGLVVFMGRVADPVGA